MSRPTLPHELLIRAVLDRGDSIQWHVLGDAWMLLLLTPREALHCLVAFPDRTYRIAPKPVEVWYSTYKNGRISPHGSGRDTAFSVSKCVICIAFADDTLAEPVKRGMYDAFYINETNCEQWFASTAEVELHRGSDKR